MKSWVFPVSATLLGHVAAGPVPRSQHASLASPESGSFGPFSFTSTYNLVATPDAVVNMENIQVLGEAGAVGYYNYGINSELDIICYNITLTGVTGPYDSPAITATHIHEAAAGQAGPPRIAFPNPEPADSGPEVVKRSSGCLQGPFTTGVKDDNEVDTGEGFRLSQIEENPTGFFTDSHTVLSVDGVVRSQLDLNGGANGAVQGESGACSTQLVVAGPPVTIVCLN